MFSKIKRVFKKDVNDRKVDKTKEDLNLEKEDLKAMIIAALLTFMPVIIFIAVLFYAIIYILFT